MTDDHLADPDFFTSQLLAWYEEHGRDFPWRQTDDPYRILICEVLLRRSRSTTVAKVTDRLFERWPTPAALADAEAADVTDVSRPLGLTKRAVQLIKLGRALREASTFPESIEALTELPGVGRYAAAATLGEPTVDGTSARVYRRYFGWLDAPEHKTVDDELWKLANIVLPAEADAVRWVNWAVLDLAASVCTPHQAAHGAANARSRHDADRYIPPHRNINPPAACLPGTEAETNDQSIHLPCARSPSRSQGCQPPNRPSAPLRSLPVIPRGLRLTEWEK